MTSGGKNDRPAGGSEAEERRLIRQARRGNERAFETLILYYRDRVHRTAYRMVQNPEDAADVAQETFIKVWRNLPAIRADVTFSSWIYRITVNTALDRLRQASRTRTETLESVDMKILSLEHYREGPRESARETEFREKVEQALAHLSDRQKAVFVLRHFEGLKLREISEVLDCPLGTVKATLHHALIALRDRLVRDGVIKRTAEEPSRKPRGKGNPHRNQSETNGI